MNKIVIMNPRRWANRWIDEYRKLVKDGILIPEAFVAMEIRRYALFQAMDAKPSRAKIIELHSKYSKQDVFSRAKKTESQQAN